MNRPLPLLFAWAVACGNTSPEGPVDYDRLGPAAQAKEAARREASRALPTAPVDAQAWAEQAATEAARGLKKRLSSALKAGGPAEAVTACKLQAPTVSTDIAEIRGVRVGRTSRRLRNPSNRAVPAWVQSWLDKHGSPTTTAAPSVSTTAEAEDGRQVARVLRPLVVEPVCLTCHGPKDTVAVSVRERLAALYPEDAALGYTAGELRGALWAEYAFQTDN